MASELKTASFDRCYLLFFAEFVVIVKYCVSSFDSSSSFTTILWLASGLGRTVCAAMDAVDSTLDMNPNCEERSAADYLV